MTSLLYINIFKYHFVFVRITSKNIAVFSGVASSLIVLLLIVMAVVFVLRRRKPQRVVKTDINDVYGVYYAGDHYFLVLIKLSNNYQDSTNFHLTFRG